MVCLTPLAFMAMKGAESQTKAPSQSALKSLSAEEIVKTIEQYGPSHVFSNVIRSAELRRKMSGELVSLCRASEASITAACKKLDADICDNMNQRDEDVYPGTIFACKIWFLLMYSVNHGDRVQTEREYSHYHGWLEPRGNSPRTYDFPWAYCSASGWQIGDFSYRVMGGLPTFTALHQVFSKLHRRKLKA